MKVKTFFYFLASAILVISGVGSILYLSFNVVLQILGTGGSWTALGILVFYLFTSVPAYQGAGAWIARGLSFWKWGSKNAIALPIEQRLNTIQEELNSEVTGLMPYPAKVEWVDKPSYLNTDEEKVIIRMKEPEENPRNIAYAVVDYVSHGMVPFSRMYLETPIQTAMDSTMVKQILIGRDKSALDYFLTHVLSKEIDGDGVKDYLVIMDNLVKRGIFTRIFLEEIRELGLKLYPIENPVAHQEVKEFLAGLNVIATHKKGERDESFPTYIGRQIKVSYLRIADPEKIRRIGHGRYVLAAMRCINDGCEALYLLSRGRQNKPAEAIAEMISKASRFRVINLSHFEEIRDGELIQGLCIEMRLQVTEKQEQRVD